MIGHEGKEHGFDILLDAVLHEPHKVKDIATKNREFLESKNYTGETVLHWCAVENRTDDIELLRSLGASIPSFALIEALESGHTETAILLLELGVEVDALTCKRALERNMFNLNAKTVKIMKSYFQQYGHEI